MSRKDHVLVGTRRDRSVVQRHHDGASLRTIATEFSLAVSTVLTIVARDDLAHTGPGQRLSQRSYDALVEGWNTKLRTDRQAAARICAVDGHEYCETPATGTFVCRRCLNYDVRTKSRKAA